MLHMRTALIAATLLLCGPVVAVSPALAQSYDSSAPRAGSTIEREALPPYPSQSGPPPPPPASYPPQGGYPPPAYGDGGRRAQRDDAYRPSRPAERYEDAGSYRDYREGPPPPPPGYGTPYEPPRAYDSGPRPHDYDEPPPNDGTFTMREITAAGHGFFGSVSQGLASVIEHAFRKQGRPNGYILGEDIGGAFVAGLRYGEGWLTTRDAGRHKVYWQGPSLGYDAGAEGSKVMVLVYNLRDPEEIYERFGGVAGSAYVVGGVGLTFQSHGRVVLAPIRSGIGLRLGANIGYLKYTRRPTWNPF